MVTSSTAGGVPRRSGGYPEPGCLDGGTRCRQDAGPHPACPV